MRGADRTLLKKYFLTVFFGGVIVVTYVLSRGLFSASLMEAYRILCDGFTVAGLLMLSSACLIALSNKGVFHGLSYVMSYAVRTFIPGGRDHQEKYYDYVQHRQEKRVKGFGFLFVTGAVFMGIALVFLVLFEALYTNSL